MNLIKPATNLSRDSRSLKALSFVQSVPLYVGSHQTLSIVWLKFPNGFSDPKATGMPGSNSVNVKESNVDQRPMASDGGEL